MNLSNSYPLPNIFATIDTATNTNSKASSPAVNISYSSTKQLTQLDIMMFYQSQPSNLFPVETQYPDFFNQNLTNTSRVIKSPIPTPHTNIQIFYYQLLVLGFELSDIDGSKTKIIQKFKELSLSEQFQILFTRDTQEYREIFNDRQFKSLLSQFFALLETTAESVEDVLNRLPIIDTVLTHVIRSFLFYLGINEEFEKEIPTEVLFIQLAEQLGMRLTCYSFEKGVCWKFEDSDMFCLDEREGKLYLAYIPIESNQQEGSESIKSSELEESIKQNFQNSIDKSYNIIVSSQQPPAISSQFQQISSSFKIHNQPLVNQSQQQSHSNFQYQSHSQFKQQSSNQFNDPEINKFNLSNNESINLGSQTFLHIINHFDNCRMTSYAAAEASNNDTVLRNVVQYDSHNLVAFEPTSDTTIKFQPNSGLLFSFSRLPQHDDIVMEPTAPASSSLSSSNIRLNSPIIPSQMISYSKTNISNIYSNPQQSIRGNFMKNKNSENKKNTSVEFKEWKPIVGYEREKERIKIATDYKEKSISDFYNDFTSSFTLNSISEPYRSEVRNIKTRIKGFKKY